MARAAGLKDIAAKAGVNISTVSRALKGNTELRSETRDRILRIAKDLGYKARMPRKRLSDAERSSIGIICPEVKSDLYGHLVNTVEEQLKAQGYHLVIGLTDFRYEDESYYLELFRQRRVAGIIFITSINREIEDDLAAFKAKCDIPLVQVGSLTKYDGYDYVEIDDERGVTLAVEHLVELGHVRIGYVGDRLSSVRVGCFEATLHRHGIEVDRELVRIGEERFEEGGYLRMREILSLREPVTAIFASYDDVAIGAMRAIYDAGLRIPDDISIAAVDDIRVTGYLHSRLTTVSEPIHQMGATAAQMLVQRIVSKEHNAIQHVKLIPELIVRDTTARIGRT